MGRTLTTVKPGSSSGSPWRQSYPGFRIASFELCQCILVRRHIDFDRCVQPQQLGSLFNRAQQNTARFMQLIVFCFGFTIIVDSRFTQPIDRPAHRANDIIEPGELELNGRFCELDIRGFELGQALADRCANAGVTHADPGRYLAIRQTTLAQAEDATRFEPCRDPARVCRACLLEFVCGNHRSDDTSDKIECQFVRLTRRCAQRTV